MSSGAPESQQQTPSTSISGLPEVGPHLPERLSLAIQYQGAWNEFNTRITQRQNLLTIFMTVVLANWRSHRPLRPRYLQSRAVRCSGGVSPIRWSSSET
jgi:hypothetical protein